MIARCRAHAWVTLLSVVGSASHAVGIRRARMQNYCVRPRAHGREQTHLMRVTIACSASRALSIASPSVSRIEIGVTKSGSEKV
jgi:hypothetical protein